MATPLLKRPGDILLTGIFFIGLKRYLFDIHNMRHRVTFVMSLVLLTPISAAMSRVFSARQHICYSALYAIARLSVPRVDQSKTVEVRITQPSPQSSPMTLVS